MSAGLGLRSKHLVYNQPHQFGNMILWNWTWLWISGTARGTLWPMTSRRNPCSYWRMLWMKTLRRSTERQGRAWCYPASFKMLFEISEATQALRPELSSWKCMEGRSCRGLHTSSALLNHPYFHLADSSRIAGIFSWKQYHRTPLCHQWHSKYPKVQPKSIGPSICF